MSDNEDVGIEEKVFCVDRAKQGRATCKKCKQKCLAGELRIAKVVPSPYGSGQMKNWHHVNCIFEQFLKQRPTTKRIESIDDMEGWENLDQNDKNEILKKVAETQQLITAKYGINISPKKQKIVNEKVSPKNGNLTSSSYSSATAASSSTKLKNNETYAEKLSIHKDLLFRTFRRLVADVSNVSSYTDKTNFISKLFSTGSDGISFKGDITQWCRLLLPGTVKRIYNLQSKQLIKLFSRILDLDQSDMLEHLEQGDIGETIQHFFEQSETFKPAKKSCITIQEVDDFLEKLSLLAKEEEQMQHFRLFTKKCTSNDLKIVIRLIKHDLRMNAGAKHVLDGVHPDAYQAYQASRDLKAVVNRCLGGIVKTTNNTNAVKATISLMTPVLPMLADVCKSTEQAMKKCPNGMFSEIKYDGERVQVHKCGSDFKYFSRSLKPVLPHKVAHFKDFIPKAFPHGKDLILDSEILMIDTTTSKPLPFGTLGVHKKSEFKNANVCLFVFDCIFYNGVVLLDKPVKYRKKILKENMTEIPNHIVFSEMKEIHRAEDLSAMIAKVLKLGLEGLVLKDILSTYEPGKRHWLKLKKDYLFDGAMADSADLLVLGAWYGTGKKGGMMSVFLMGCYDPIKEKFCTVTKVHTGHDDKTLERLQKELNMVKISCDSTKVPNWLKCTKTMIPDFVARDPKVQPVWEITGAEFTQHDVHTAYGISIRFPRVTKIRDDKTWETATNLQELRDLFEKSKTTDVSLLLQHANRNMSSDEKEHVSKKNNLLDSLSKERSPKRRSDTCEVDCINRKNSKTGVDGHMNEYCNLKIKDPLPTYFKNVKLLLEKGAGEMHAELLRYFVAYGGIILTENNWKKATHVLHLRDYIFQRIIKCPKNAKHINFEWIRDTAANQSLQDFRLYTVTWQPSLADN